MLAIGLTCLLLLPQDPGRADIPSQAPPLRDRLIGRVVQADGQAWAGATVVLFHRPIPDRIDLGEPDRVELVAAANGRFRAELLHGREYMAWATGKDEEGKTWVSDVVEGVFAGETLKLEGRKVPVPPLACKVMGRKAWQDARLPEGRYRAVMGSQGLVLDLGPTGEADELVVPPLPFAGFLLQRLDPDGQVLAMARLTRPAVPLMPISFALPLPRRVRVEIRGPDGPLAGAELWAKIHEESVRRDGLEGDAEIWSRVLQRSYKKSTSWARFGRSDAQGKVDCLVPTPDRDFSLIVRADGFIERQVGLSADTAAREVPPILGPAGETTPADKSTPADEATPAGETTPADGAAPAGKAPPAKGPGPVDPATPKAEAPKQGDEDAAKQEAEKKAAQKEAEAAAARQKLAQAMNRLLGKGAPPAEDGPEGPADRIVLEPAGRLHGRILIGEDRPAADFPFVLWREGSEQSGEHGWRRYDMEPILRRTDAEGGFSVGYLPPGSNVRLLAVLTPELWEILARTYGRLPLPAAELVVFQGEIDKAGRDLGTLRLDKLVCVHATIHAARGEREARARVLLKDTREDASVTFRGPPTIVRDFNPSGEVVFLIPAAHYDTMVVHPERGACTEPLGLEPEKAPGTLHEWAVALAPFASIDVVVTDGNGAPVPGARLDMNGGGYTHLSKLCSEIYEWNQQAIEHLVVDEQGRGVLRLIPVKAQSYDVGARPASGHGGNGGRFRISTDGMPEKMELELGN